jgi:hypothetical protein
LEAVQRVITLLNTIWNPGKGEMGKMKQNLIKILKEQHKMILKKGK